MSKSEKSVSLEEQIDQWRSYLLRRQAIHSVDIAELEDHLREQVAALVKAGLSTDEAFLVAVKRMGRSTNSRGSSPASTLTASGSSSSFFPKT